MKFQPYVPDQGYTDSPDPSSYTYSEDTSYADADFGNPVDSTYDDSHRDNYPDTDEIPPITSNGYGYTGAQNFMAEENNPSTLAMPYTYGGATPDPVPPTYMDNAPSFEQVDYSPSLSSRLMRYFVTDNIKYVVVMIIVGVLYRMNYSSTPEFYAYTAIDNFNSVCANFAVFIFLKSFIRFVRN